MSYLRAGHFRHLPQLRSLEVRSISSDNHPFENSNMFMDCFQQRVESGHFTGYPSLQELKINFFAKLSALELCARIGQCRVLDLSGNNLKSLPGQLLRGMPRLRGLNLANNSIGAFERGTFESETCLETLDLSAYPVEAIKAGLFCSLVN